MMIQHIDRRCLDWTAAGDCPQHYIRISEMNGVCAVAEGHEVKLRAVLSIQYEESDELNDDESFHII